MDNMYDAFYDDMRNDDKNPHEETIYTEIQDDTMTEFMSYDRNEEKIEDLQEQFARTATQEQLLAQQSESLFRLLEEDLKDGRLDSMSLSQLSWQIDKLEDLRNVSNSNVNAFIKNITDLPDRLDEYEKESLYSALTESLHTDGRIEDIQNLYDEVLRLDFDSLKRDLKEYEDTGLLSQELINASTLAESLFDSRDESKISREEQKPVSSDSRELDTVASKLSKKS